MSRPESVEKIMRWIAYGIGLKAHMLEEDIRDHLEDCPFCDGGKVRAALAGSKDHLRMRCSTDGCIRMME